MHIENIKQGQGRRFGWRSFFKRGKQKNKIALAAATGEEAAGVPATSTVQLSEGLSSA